MDIFVKEFTDCLRQVYVNFKPEEVNAEYETALAALQKKVQFPGYRIGKVPFDLIEKNYSDDLMRSIVNNMVMKAAEKLNSDGIYMYSEPRFKPFQNLTKGNPFSFSIIFDIVPSVIENIDIDSALVEYEEYYYDDKMIDYSIQKDFKTLNQVTGKIENEDNVTVNILNQNFTGEKEKSFDSSIVKTLIGKKIGDKIKLSFSDLDSYVVDFLGKIDNEIEIEIIKVERPSIQEITDELVSQVSAFKTVTEYRNAMKNKFDNMEQEFNIISKKTALMSYISKTAKAEFPKTNFIKDSRNEVLKFIENNFFVTEISLNSLLSDKKIRDEFSLLPDKIYQGIVFYLAIDDIANKQSIQPEKSAIDNVAASYAKEHKMSLDEYKEKASKDEWDSITETAKLETTINFLIGKIKFKSKTRLPLIKTK